MAVMPLLAILAMSPAVVETKYPVRHLASIGVFPLPFPKYDAIASKIESRDRYNSIASFKPEQFKIIRDQIKAKVARTEKEFKKNQSDKKIVSEQNQRLVLLINNLVSFQRDMKNLDIKITDDKTYEESNKVLNESKFIVESLLIENEANEALVAKASKPKEETKVEVAKVEEVKKEEPKVEEAKKEEEIPAVVEVKKEEPKADDKLSKLEAELCVFQEKNKALTDKMDTLFQQQNQVMQAMLTMSQMMLTMAQKQSQDQYAPYMHGLQIQNPYQYNPPFTSGNWVYMPNNGYPNQPNIFSQPQGQPQNTPQLGGFYPDQAHQNPQPWNLQPTMNFSDPRYNPQPTMPGTFGAQDGFSFNFNGGNGMNSMSSFSGNGTPNMETMAVKPSYFNMI
jgi:hypothetical protein